MYTAIYARQSLDKKDSISIETQIDTCKKETQGEETKVYQDKGFSGKNMERPDFIRLLEELKAGRVKRVIVYKLDRISRSVLDFAKLMELFEKFQVEFVSCTEKFDTSTAMGRAMLNIAVVFAQLERETIQMRVTDAYYSRSRKGLYMGGRIPYGFKLEKAAVKGIHTSVFVPDPEEMKQIQMIYSLYAQPETTLGDVLRALTDHGFLSTRSGAPWSTAKLSGMIRNPVYVRADMEVYNFFLSQGAKLMNPPSDYIGVNGIFLYKGSDSTGNRKQYDLTDKEVVLAPHEGVIDPEVWLGCRLKLMKNRRLGCLRKGKRSWLTGKIKCKKCGYAYQFIESRGVEDGRYLQCSGGRYAVKCRGAGHTIYATEFENHVWEEMKRELEGFHYLSPDTGTDEEPVKNEYKIRLAELNAEIDSLVLRVSSANNTLLEYMNKRIETLDREKQALEKKIADIHSGTQRPETNKITDAVEKWNRLELPDKQRAADILIDRIEIGEEEIEIFWNV